MFAVYSDIYELCVRWIFLSAIVSGRTDLQTEMARARYLAVIITTFFFMSSRMFAVYSDIHDLCVRWIFLAAIVSGRTDLQTEMAGARYLAVEVISATRRPQQFLDVSISKYSEHEEFCVGYIFTCSEC
jgi:hypothetical protein